MSYGTNPILKMDYPDPDVIRVDDTYYMVTTTMHFMPGCEILRSYDLINWEHLTYVYDRLDSTDAQKLTGDKHVFGKGMWAATIRYHEGVFYIVFVANDTGKTYLYKSSDIEGPWEKSLIEGFYHDCSLLFDEGRKFLVYGNTKVYLTELNDEMTGPKEGGLHRLIVSDEGNPNLGLEGSHLYKINGRYYLFMIHSRRDRWMRTEACFSADSLEGEFVGGDVLEDDMGLTPDDIDYVNAHGTSTHMNDQGETEACKKVFGARAKDVPVSSIKSMTGHLLGAAGGVECIASVLAVENDMLPPTINYETQDDGMDLDYVPNKSRAHKVRAAISNNFGFGGHNACLVVKKFSE